jgi:hypothetical protein
MVQPEEPNYALFMKAAQTIQSLLELMSSNREPMNQELSLGQPGCSGFEDWSSLISSDPWNIDSDFWQNLAEHPLFPSNA